MKHYISSLTELFPTLIEHFFTSLLSFIRRLANLIAIFAMYGIVSYGFAILLPDLLHDWANISEDTCLLIQRILLTIAPLLPTFFYTLACTESPDEKADGYSMDLCFMVWIITAYFAWKIL